MLVCLDFSISAHPHQTTTHTDHLSGAYSTDSGKGWRLLATCVPGASQHTSGGLVAIDASGKHIVWTSPVAPASTGPYTSSDWGATWTAPTGLTVSNTNPLAAGGRLTGQYGVASDKVQAATFYTFAGGKFYISTDGGASYTVSTASGLPANTNITAQPVVGFKSAGEIWLPLDSYGLYHSSDFGTSWKMLGGAHSNITVSVSSYLTVGAGPGPGPHNYALYVWGTVTTGGVEGLYRSDDNGATWQRINDDAHQYGGPTLIQGDSRVYGRVYIGTFGRGAVWAEIAEGVIGTGVVPGTWGL